MKIVYQISLYKCWSAHLPTPIVAYMFPNKILFIKPLHSTRVTVRDPFASTLGAAFGTNAGMMCSIRLKNGLYLILNMGRVCFFLTERLSLKKYKKLKIIFSQFFPNYKYDNSFVIFRNVPDLIWR